MRRINLGIALALSVGCAAAAEKDVAERFMVIDEITTAPECPRLSRRQRKRKKSEAARLLKKSGAGVT